MSQEAQITRREVLGGMLGGLGKLVLASTVMGVGWTYGQREWDRITKKGATELRLEDTLRRLRDCPKNVIWDSCPETHKPLNILSIQEYNFWHAYMHEEIPGIMILSSENRNIPIPVIDSRDKETYQNLDCYGYIPFLRSLNFPSNISLPDNPTIRQQIEYELNLRITQRCQDLNKLFFTSEGKINVLLKDSYLICIPREMKPISNASKNIYLPNFCYTKENENFGGPFIMGAGIYIDCADNIYNPVGFVRKNST